MYCTNQINHIIKQGDTFYLLAKHYHTTADRLMALNPSKDPYNLQIGDTLIICPGPTYPTTPIQPDCTDKINHIIKQGDTFYLLARHYHTTADRLMALNPSKDPYNLQIGDTLIICPGPTYPTTPIPPIGTIPPCPVHPVPPIGVVPLPPPVRPVPPIGVVPPIQPPIGIMPPRPTPPVQPPEHCNDAVWKMRHVWLQHIYWTRMVLISIASRLKDKTATVDRLMRNPGDMAKVFGEYFSKENTSKIERLFREHLQIGGELITALSEGRSAAANNLNTEWYKNADRIAEFFSTLSSAYPIEETRRHMYRHLDLTKQQVSARLLGQHMSEIEAFDRGEKEALMMADYFAKGIL